MFFNVLSFDLLSKLYNTIDNRILDKSTFKQ